jgi:hypothetical protein
MEMRGASDEGRNVGLLDDDLNGLAFLRIPSRGNEHTGVVGHMSHEFTVANGVGPEAARTVMVWQQWGRCYNMGVEVKFLVGPRVSV